MGKIKVLALCAVVGLCAACADRGAASSDKPHATVLMRDGTQMTGTVTASSASEITLTGDDNVARPIPMKQVKSISYDDPAAVAATASASAQATSTQAPPDAPHDNHYHAPQSAIRTQTYRVPAGTQVVVRSEETIDSGKAAEGQTFAAEVTKDVLDDAGAVVIPRGSNAVIVIKSASKGGRFHGASDLVLDLQSVSVEGQEYQLDTSDIEQKGRDGVGANRRTAEFAGGAAAVGAIIGAIAGGGKGAAIGAGSGAGAGALTEILTKGGSIRVPVETVLTFKLDRTLRVVAAK